MMASFRYEPLFIDGPSIRLLRLLKASCSKYDEICDYSGRPTPQPPIQCDIQVSYIGSGRVKYDAVSYCWMTDKRTQTIYVSGKPFLVSPVVEDILIRLRDEKEDRLLWLDLICIDQSNEIEKGMQVRRMRDIFREAETVIVSLGPHSDAAWISLQEMRPLGERIDRDKPYRPRSKWASDRWRYDGALKLITSTWGTLVPSRVPLSQSDSDDLDAFVRHPWFDRVWVLQEVAAARQLLILCRDKEIEGKYFARLHARILPRVRNPNLRTRLERLRPLLEYVSKGLGESRRKEELLTLLHQFRTWKATVPHDKVYALMGMSEDGLLAPQLVPDYTLPVETVYKRVVHYMISRYDSLTVLTHANGLAKIEEPRQTWASWLWGSDMTSRPGFPSWCPDWRSDHQLETPERVPVPDIHTSSPHVSAPIAANSDYDAGVLRVSGITVASIHSAQSMEVVIPKPLQGVIQDLPTTCHELSEDLKNVSASLVSARGEGLLINDQICVLEGSTGVAILRPKGNVVQLISLRHSQFTKISIDLFGCQMRDTAAAFFSNSVYGRIVQRLVSRDMNIPTRYTASWQIFDIV